VSGLEERAAELLALHHADDPLVLANAWDPASAAVIAAAGATVIATSSAGVAWTLGYADGEAIERDEMIAAVARIVRVVDVPVTADLERGYGDVGATVEAAVGVGAVGANIEDSTAGRELVASDTQTARLRAGRDAAVAAGVPSFVLNARTDVFLRQIGEPEGRLDETKRRAGEYAAAGASCLFVPGLLDLEALEELAAASPIPISVLARPDGPTVAELAATGVRRVSIGPAVSEAVYGLARRAAAELLQSGTYESLTPAIGFPELQSLLGGR
jgi:2-methylisocitrate lyase-like PEP mutase family enzyme